MAIPKGMLRNASLTFGYFLALMIPAFLLTGGGHGTGLFAAIALSPGSLFGDNAWALTGILFWVALGAVLTQPLSAQRRMAALLLLLLHYGAALFWGLQSGSDGFQGLQRITSVAMPYVVVFAVIYLVGQIAFWRIILMPHKSPQEGGLA